MGEGENLFNSLLHYSCFTLGRFEEYDELKDDVKKRINPLVTKRYIYTA